MPYIILIAFVSMLNLSELIAASSIVGVLDEDTGDLTIQILDDPGSPSNFDAVELWSAMIGDENSKYVDSEALYIKCNTVLAAPYSRHGSCLIEILAKKIVKQSNGDVGALFSGAEAQNILSKFVGSSKDVNLGNGKLLLAADHPRKLFSILVARELLR